MPHDPDILCPSASFAGVSIAALRSDWAQLAGLVAVVALFFGVRA